MMAILVFAGIPILLLLLLSMLGATWNLEVDSPDEEAELLTRHFPAHKDSTECVCRIFSPEDQKFVDRQGSPRLRHIYRAERTRVALYWVRMISGEVSQIMREHRLAAGSKENLQARREVELILQYVQFRLLCSLLVFSIRVFGPHALVNMATHVLQVSEGIGRVLEQTTEASRIQAAGSLGGA